eukprot:NODE_415_length_7892_cov_0.421917.p1 type:complete len:726 gc:universal NODE_415_length_7892_cov_0.421917:6738-4561(-)
MLNMLMIPPRFNSNVKGTPDIYSINKHIKNKQRKYSRSKSKYRKSKILKQIQSSRKQYNKLVEQQVFQTQLELMEDLSKDPSSAYQKLCQIKNKTTKAQVFCEIDEMIEFQKEHFNHKQHEWKKDFLSTEDINKSKEIIAKIFTTKIIKSELQHLNIKKASGGMLPSIALKFLPRNGAKVIRHLFSLSYLNGEIPKSWNESGLVEIFKNKGSSDDPKYYRPVSLLVTLRKLFEKIIYYFHFREKLIPSNKQHGFCTSRSTLTQLHYVNNLISKFRKKGDVIMGSLDLSSAFDCIIYDDIVRFTRDKLDKNDLNVIRSLIVNQSIYLTRDSQKSSINMKKGVPQGGTLSPMLFSFVIDKIISELNYDCNKLAICLYADDIFIISNDTIYFNQILKQITDLLINYSFKPNPNKYQICASKDVDVQLNQLNIKQSPWIKYLGVHLNCTGIDYDKEISWKKSKLAFLKKQYRQINNDLSGNSLENTGHLFHGRTLFTKGVIESIISYGITLWNRHHLPKLESIRRNAINGLFSNTRKIHELLGKFHNADELYSKARISSENQIYNVIKQLQNEDLETPDIYIDLLKCNTSISNNINEYEPLVHETREELDAAVEERLVEMWDSNEAKRATNLPISSTLLQLLLKNKYFYNYTHHVLRLGVKFLMGHFPIKKGICKMCMQPFDSLFHFEGECTNNYKHWDEMYIYNILKSGTEDQIFDLLKSLKNIITPA